MIFDAALPFITQHTARSTKARKAQGASGKRREQVANNRACRNKKYFTC